MGVGMPTQLLLLEFGEHVHRAFGHMAYWVGSSLPTEKKTGWRDVDIRVMLPDEEYIPYGDPANPHQNKKWVSTVRAWSCFGESLTGLPIDFQVQQLTYANEQFGRKEGGTRSACFAIWDMKPAGPACKYCGCSNCAGECVSPACRTLDIVEGLIPVDPAALIEFETEMRERTIPAIEEIMRKRAEAAAISRTKPI